MYQSETRRKKTVCPQSPPFLVINVPIMVSFTMSLSFVDEDATTMDEGHDGSMLLGFDCIFILPHKNATKVATKPKKKNEMQKVFVLQRINHGKQIMTILHNSKWFCLSFIKKGKHMFLIFLDLKFSIPPHLPIKLSCVH